jgi:ubiquinone/menaquinone biosynthesis C-methylase UbiE
VNVRLRSLLKGLTPPLLWAAARSAAGRRRSEGKRQELDIYWQPEMSQLLETWGEGNAWHEIRLILSGRRGKVLDIACGTGKVMAMVQADAGLEVHGCDISDVLIAHAVQRGVPAHRLTICDATRLPFEERLFDFAYSIGSLEHFTEEGIEQVLRGCRRVVKGASFHMIPVSRSGLDEGWITPYQAYFNNSASWWAERARRVFPRVALLDSIWSDERSVGKWLVCEPGAPA